MDPEKMGVGEALVDQHWTDTVEQTGVTQG